MRMKFKKSLTYLAIVLMAVIGVNLVAVTPAAAAPYCQNGYVCMYEHTGGNGTAYWQTGVYGECINFSGAWNDRVSSVRNGMWFSVRLWQNSNCSGWSVSLGAECGGCLSSYINDLGGFPYFFNDTASSISFY